MIPPELASLVLRAVDDSKGVMIVGGDGTTEQRLYVNQRAAEIIGWRREDLEKKTLGEILAPEELPRLAELLATWRGGGDMPRKIEWMYLAEDGRRVPVEATTFEVAHEGRKYIVAFYSDISERVRARAALAASELRFRQLTEASPDSITVIQNGRFVYANPAAVRVLGFSDMNEFIARPLAELLDPEETAVMGERIARVRAGEHVGPREYGGRHKDGSKRALEISSIAIELDGKPAVVAFGRDLSDRKAMEADLRRAERMATIGMLAAGVAHEINNPMAYVMLNLEQVRARLSAPIEDAQEVSELVDACIDGCERVASITRQLLLFSRPERPPGVVDVSETLEAALKLAASPLRRVARVEQRIAGSVFVRAEERRLTQVFLNLLLNAAEVLGDRCADENVVAVEVREGDSVLVEISDNGPGIRACDLERIFEPFFTTKPSGTGLGLAISRSIVESFGGTLEVFVPPHGGTTFRVGLARGQREPLSPVPHDEAHRRASIVVIDDEPLVARALSKMLGAKHDVTVHTAPREALQRLLEGSAVEVVVCDLAMPELTGMELYARLCEARPEYRERFIFVTGGTTTQEAAAFVATVSAKTLPKPFDMVAIESAIRECLARSMAS
ncbi:MAG: PAS domain S-box protein [Polyangiaceae bacterium]|nr:PAS domain S-box protein [Polyangiaceae bacterium]